MYVRSVLGESISKYICDPTGILSSLEPTETEDIQQMDFFTILALATFVVCLIVAFSCLLIACCQRVMQYCQQHHMVHPLPLEQSQATRVETPSVNLTNSEDEVVENIIDFPPLHSPPAYRKDKVRFVQPGVQVWKKTTKANSPSHATDSGNHLSVSEVMSESDVTSDGLIQKASESKTPKYSKSISSLP